MTHDEQRTTQVLIAGAGPAGLTAAIALGRQGVDTLVVDRKRELSSLPRATVISTRSMELLRSWGLEQDILAGAIDVEWRMWSCESLALASAGQGCSGGPADAGAERRGEPRSARVRAAGSHRARAAGARAFARLASAWSSAPRWPASRATRTAPRVVLRDAAGSASRVVHARYLIAADGAHSTVRNELGIAVHGPGGFMHAASVLFRAPLWDVAGAHRYGIYDIGHPEAPGALLPAGRGDRWIYGVRWEPGTRQLEEFTEEALHPLDPARHGRRRPAAGDPADRRLLLRRAAGGALPQRQHVPRGRRRAPRVPARRHGDEHRDPRRLRPRLEARLGAARLGTARAARFLRARAPSGGRAQPRTLGRSQRLGPGCRPGTARRPGRPHRARVGAGARRPGLDARPAGRRADPLHRAAEQSLGERRRLRAGLPSGCRPAPRCHHCARARHPHRRRVAHPSRRRTRRLVVEQRRCGAGAACGCEGDRSPGARAAQAELAVA